MSRWEPTAAVVLRGPEAFVRNQVRLMVRHDGAYLRADGNWQTFEDGVRVDGDDMGIVLPAATVEAIAVAIAEYQGHTSHADTEARVLREALDVERARVDRVLQGVSDATK